MIGNFTLIVHSQEEGSVLMKIETPVIGIMDTFRLRIEVRKANLIHINDNTLFYDFEQVGELRYLKNEKTGFFEVEYKLKPMNRGTYTIQGAVASFKDGSKIKSNSVTITVVDGSIYKNVEEEDPIKKIPPDKRVFAQLETDKNTYYKGETMILTAYLYSVYPIERKYQYKGKKPTFQDDFWGSGYDELIVMSAKPSKEKLYNVEYTKKLLDKRILYAKKPGDYSFGSYNWQAQPGGGKVYEGRYELKSNELTITVKPLPDKGKPENFKNSVGEFNISLNVSGNDGYNRERQPVFTGDSYIKASVTISGRANPDTVNDPNSEKFEKDFKIISVNTIPKQKLVEKGYSFSKTYEYLLQPKGAGILEIPSLDYTYFNPKKERYVIDKTKPLKIEVLGEAVPNTSKDNGVIDEQLAEVRARLNSIREPKRLTNVSAYLLTGLNRVFILIYILFIILLTPASFWVYRYRMKLKENSSLIRRSNAGSNAITRLKEVRSHIKDNHELHDVYDELYDILLTYLADAYTLSKGNTNMKKIITEKLEIAKEKDPSLMSEVKNFLERLDFIKFSGETNFTKRDVNNDIDLILKTINTLEQTIK